jgi:uncharacterized protein YecT (DUF1311 family)
VRSFWLAPLAFWFTAHSAFAIDCVRARSDIEHAICGNAEAQAADQALGIAFDHVRNLLPDDERAGLRSSQINWLRTRDAACLAKRADTPLPKCLAEVSEKRRRFLEGKPATGDAEQNLFRPVFIFRPATKGTAQLSIEAIRFTGTSAWQTTANASIDKLVKDAIDDADVRDSRPPEPGESYSVELSISLPFASPRLVSIHAGYSNYLGQAHPNHSATNVNIDIPTGRELSFDDRFDAAKAGELFQYCRAQIVKEKSESADIHGVSGDEAGDVELQEVMDGTKNVSNWAFTASGVEIDYGDGAFGGYGRCMCSCTIPYSRLRPIAHGDQPLP